MTNQLEYLNASLIIEREILEKIKAEKEAQISAQDQKISEIEEAINSLRP